MANILLLGAGFTRNWGGWLAPEVFEYLLGRPEIDEFLRNLLFKHRRAGGYEGALSELQSDVLRGGARDKLIAFENALAQMFADMDKGLERIAFEFQSDGAYMVRTFLTRFDAIFTLNQDLLLERYYLNDNVMLTDPRRWGGWQVPGMQRQGGGYASAALNCGIWTPNGQAPQPRLQPYFKLHGSSNWRDGGGARIIVAGGNKPALVNQFPVLAAYHGEFRRYLSGPTCLTVIGYGFGDDHINDMILAAAGAGQLKLFIIDPLGLDVIDENRTHAIYSPGKLMSGLGPTAAGASRRSLRDIFGSDRVEHAKVASFFE
jgi:hypothetical protein